MQKITKRFNKACADYHLLEDGDHVLIGLSGGKDSLLLTELLGRRAKIYKPRFTVTALHVRVKERDYQTDLSYLESFCAEAGVPLLVRDTEIGEAPANAQSSNLQIFKSSNRKSPCFLCSWYRRKTLFHVAQELGCNKIALGHRSYGVAAAAQTYYGKNLDELTLGQMATIAGLPNGTTLSILSHCLM